MKKIVLCLLIVAGFAFAEEVQKKEIKFAQAGCIETEISLDTSILSCPSGDYKLSYRVAYNKRVVNSVKMTMLNSK